jgi:hypothetical protein
MTRRAIALWHGHARDAARRAIALLCTARVLPEACSSVSSSLLHTQALASAIEAMEWKQRARDLTLGLSRLERHDEEREAAE